MEILKSLLLCLISLWVYQVWSAPVLSPEPSSVDHPAGNEVDSEDLFVAENGDVTSESVTEKDLSQPELGKDSSGNVNLTLEACRATASQPGSEEKSGLATTSQPSLGNGSSGEVKPTLETGVATTLQLSSGIVPSVEGKLTAEPGLITTSQPSLGKGSFGLVNYVVDASVVTTLQPSLGNGSSSEVKPTLETGVDATLQPTPGIVPSEEVKHTAEPDLTTSQPSSVMESSGTVTPDANQEQEQSIKGLPLPSNWKASEENLYTFAEENLQALKAKVKHEGLWVLLSSLLKEQAFSPVVAQEFLSA
ncbi:melanoma-associated antigen E1-like isoform X2 [Hoplias malabaricus]|uniref:melanoma-associated antigen E1-like isoform X2 n=1 Tax=Hoplias malabaricus TaxID=27720 RepID=UPI0034629B2B